MKNGILKTILTSMLFLAFIAYSDYKKTGVKVSNPNVKISTERAKELMFIHAGISKNGVRITKLLLNKENRKYFYMIEFFTEDKKYRYSIDAETGDVINYSQEKRKRNENKSKGIFWDIFMSETSQSKKI
jgi:hypothetical protein